MTDKIPMSQFIEVAVGMAQFHVGEKVTEFRYSDMGDVTRTRHIFSTPIRISHNDKPRHVKKKINKALEGATVIEEREK